MAGMAGMAGMVVGESGDVRGDGDGSERGVCAVLSEMLPAVHSSGSRSVTRAMKHRIHRAVAAAVGVHYLFLHFPQCQGLKYELRCVLLVRSQPVTR